jgi:alpha-1,2-mannosyltransferase
MLVLATEKVASAGEHHSDFGTFWRAGRAVLHGATPYPLPASLPAHAGPTFAPFVYPPVTAFAFAPFAVLPYRAAAVAFFVVSLAAVVLSLRLLGVRDVRCYGVVLASPPVFASTVLGTVTPLLLLGVAAGWRYRERAVALGLLVAAVVTAKLFLWPVWLWLVRTRRFRAAAVAAAAGAAALVVPWAAIDFAGLREYPELLHRLTGLVGWKSYSLAALGAGPLVPVLALLALAAAAVFVRGDGRLLLAALGVALLATPILWPHYLLLLLVPLALARPAFSPAWLAPLVLWVDAAGSSGGSATRIAALLGLAAAGLAWSFVAYREESPLSAACSASLPGSSPKRSSWAVCSLWSIFSGSSSRAF